MVCVGNMCVSDACCCVMLIPSALYVIADGDLKTDGFTIESCRSMVAVMDVSFLVWSEQLLSYKPNFCADFSGKSITIILADTDRTIIILLAVNGYTILTWLKIKRNQLF